MKLWNFACESCGMQQHDQFFTGKIPKSIPCECGKRATWDFNKRRAQIHQTASGRKYGEYDPQFGCVVEDYAHKQKLLRQMGAEEVGVVSEDQIREEMWEAQQNAPKRSEGVIAADSLDELDAEVEKHNATARKGDLQESWVSL